MFPISKRTRTVRWIRSAAAVSVALALLGNASTGPTWDNSPPASGCGEGLVALTPQPNSEIFVCYDQQHAHTYLFNDSDFVWNVYDHDPGPYSVTVVYESPSSEVFHTTFASYFASHALAAPRDVIQLPDGYRNLTISPHQNMSVAWTEQLRLERAVANATKTKLIAIYASGSRTRNAVVKCASAGWSAVRGTENVQKTPDLQSLIVNGLGVSTNAVKCKKAINAASDIPDSKLLKRFDSEITKADEFVKEGESMVKMQDELVEQLGHVLRYFHE